MIKAKFIKAQFVFLFIALAFSACDKKVDPSKAEKLKLEAESFLDMKNFKATIETASNALKLFEAAQDTLGIIETGYLISRASALSGNFEDAKKYGEQASNLCKTLRNYPLEYKINNTLSWSYFELGKGFNETFEHNQRQLYVVEQMDDDASKAMVYNNYGYDGTVSGKIPLDKAVFYAKFANDHYAKTENTKGRWYTLMNLTWQHRLLNELEQSETYGRLSVAQAETDEDRHAIIEANTNLGETLLLQNKLEEAKPLYERGLELSRQQDDRDKYVFDVYYAHYLWKLGEKERAISILKRAIAFLESSEIFYEMKGRAFLAEFSYEMNDLEEANSQIAVFKNPRADYFSQEAKAMVSMVEAQLLEETDKNAALALLKQLQSELNVSGAKALQKRITKLIDDLKAFN